MNGAPHSIYPDFLRAGLGRLQTLGVGQDLLSLFAALEHLRRELQEQEEIDGILEVTHRYLVGLSLCHTSAFYLVSPTDCSFELAFCSPDTAREELQQAVQQEIAAGRFAWALRQSQPVSFNLPAVGEPSRGVFHAMNVLNKTVGMYCGLLYRDRPAGQEVAFSLLSMLVGTCADALANARRTAALTREIKTLSGLLPICAWCKKIRDDGGYWKQLESYITTRTGAVFSHGVCPECQRKLEASIHETQDFSNG